MVFDDWIAYASTSYHRKQTGLIISASDTSLTYSAKQPRKKVTSPLKRVRFLCYLFILSF